MKELAQVQVTHPAMGSEFELLLEGPDRTHLREVAQVACEEIDALEQQLSSYIPTSDVCWLNRTAPQRPARVEPELFRLLQRAHQVHAETEGAFDITVGPLIKCWGFFRRQGALPSAEALAAARTQMGMEHIHLDPTDRSVSFDRAGIEINLGGIGKGYAVQRVIDLLRRYRVDRAFIHVGHSSMTAWGRLSGDPGWPVGLRHPRRVDKRLGTVYLHDGSLSASGDYEQFFEVGGQSYSHILDPRTGAPAPGTWSAWAQTPDGAWADALSTAFFVLGIGKTRQYCRVHEEVGAALVPANAGEPELIRIGKMEIESP